jgi:hypothetical protein
MEPTIESLDNLLAEIINKAKDLSVSDTELIDALMKMEDYEGQFATCRVTGESQGEADRQGRSLHGTAPIK